MRRWLTGGLFGGLIACLFGVTALAAWHFFGDERAPAVSVPIAAPLRYNLPDTPQEWRGRVDYRQLDQSLATLALRPEMAGLAVAVVEQGELRFVGTYGTADRSTGAPVTPETLFRWASVSKTATGMLAATLAADGSVDLASPLTRWGTSLRLPGGAETRLTLAQLLAQQTGLTKNAYDERLEDGQDPVVIRASLAGAPLQCEPGSCYTYQNVAFDAAGEILSEAARQPFADVMTERFFRPLGMTSAGYGMARLANAKNWARPHHLGLVRPLKEAYWRVPAAAGVDSNIVDFATWMQAAMGMRPDVLPAPVRQNAMQPRVATDRPYSGMLSRELSDARYGLGWRSFSYDGRLLAGHSGAVSGYRATMIFEPSTRTGVVVMWNSNWGVPFRIPFAVIDSFHGRSNARWFDLSDVPLPGAAPAEGDPAVTPPLAAGPPTPQPAASDNSRR
jgi:beta-lactamase class C